LCRVRGGDNRIIQCKDHDTERVPGRLVGHRFHASVQVG
jgi:hypothetical protein